MSKYIVVIESQYSQDAMLAVLNYSGERYEIVATGKYSVMLDLAERLNA